jgi:putative (di)nucleoside polyphosphate hydrolase
MKLGPSGLPYRPCVGAIILNDKNQVWVGRRFDAPGDAEGRGTWWQMPQGGIDDDEEPSVAVLREIREETSLTSLTILAELPGWHYYDLPAPLVAKKMWGGRYGGQRQKWFAVRFTGHDSEVDISPTNGPHPEFDAWRWATPAELPDIIVPFKKQVYAAVLADLEKLNLGGQSTSPSP